MKQEYAAMKFILARIIYRNMYGDNYGPVSSEVEQISDHVNKTNKLALALAGKNRKQENMLGQSYLVTSESPVSKADSLLNKKALKRAG